jgi:Fe2+ or Zn2+ uptake regulation protein
MKKVCALCQEPCERFHLICSSCDEVMHSGLEEYSVMAQALMSRRFPTPDDDPWA